MTSVGGAFWPPPIKEWHVNVRLEGSWTVERAGELKDLLSQAVSSGEGVEVDFSAVEDADLSFYQLLHAAQKDCAKSGTAIRFLPSMDSGFLAHARWCGLAGIVSPKD
jgi:hypothetical protein